jgi:branched-chain amino acid transport system ATP-binding protein
MGAYLASRELVRQRLEEVLRLFPHLASRLDRLCANLSGGEQQMVAIGRGLMAAPRLLLMDEPSLGLAPLVVRDMFEVIGKIAATGTTVLLVEQNTTAALEISRFGYVLETGTVALDGEAAALRANPHVKEAYLGL